MGSHLVLPGQRSFLRGSLINAPSTSNSAQYMVGTQYIFVGQMSELTQFQLIAVNLDILISFYSFIDDNYLISSRLNDCSTCYILFFNGNPWVELGEGIYVRSKSNHLVFCPLIFLEDIF